MRKTFVSLVVTAGMIPLAATSLPAQEATPPASPSSSSTPAGEIAAAAKTFLDTLDDTLRSQLVYDFNDREQRRRWSNFPSPIFERGGLRMGDLTQAQRAAAMTVLAAALSPEGYEKVLRIVEADQALKETGSGGLEGPGRGPGGRRGGPGGGLIFGHDNYYISFLGEPSASEPWMIQFGGHHLAINLTLAGERGTLAPSHTGAQPAIYEIEGKMVRPLGDETDKAFALFSSLDETQRQQALIGAKMHDLVLGPGRDGQTIAPEGIQGSALSDKQREMLLDLAGEWTGIQNEAHARTRMEEMKKNIVRTWFAWSGPTEKGGAAYFRIQGPTIIIEYAPQRMGGDATGHIHTIYRDPTNDYGVKWLKP